MIGSFLTRGLVMVFGYAYPAYECYKTVEKNRPEIEQLRFWCQYWILVAVLTVSERLGDTFISWVPMYSEAKLAFFIYLWYPKTRGTTYVYDSFFKPYVAKHENEIDRNLLELRTRAGDMAVLYWQRAASYGQTRVFEILQYVAAQSTSRPSTAQQGVKARPPGTAPNRQPSTRQPVPPPPENELPPSPTSSTSSSQQFMDVSEEVAPQPREPTAPPVSFLNTLKSPPPTSITQKAPTGTSSTSSKPNATPETSLQSLLSSKDEAVITEATANGNGNSPKKDTNMDEAIRVTRARLRKARSVPKS